MLFHPDDGKTIEEIIQWEWEHKFSAELKAYVLGLADSTGRSWFDIVCDRLEQFFDDLDNNPEKRARFTAHLEFRQTPLGKDPLLK